MTAESRPACRAAARDLGIERSVAFLGQQPPSIVQQEMRGARGFVQHSVEASKRARARIAARFSKTESLARLWTTIERAMHDRAQKNPEAQPPL